MTGAKGVALTPPQTFPARLGAKGEGSSPGVGRWNPGSRAGRGRREVGPGAIWRRNSGFSAGRGPLPAPPAPIAGISLRRVLAGAHAPRCPGSRCPEPPAPTCARLPGAPPTHRTRVAGPTDGLGREARPPGCFEALGWDCALSLLPLAGAEPPPPVPLLSRHRLPGRDVRSPESRRGGTAGGGWGTREGKAGARGAPPAPARPPALLWATLGQSW